MWDIEKSRRMEILTIIIFGIIALLLLRLAWMQLIHGAQYKKIAEDNRLHKVYQQAPRGTIYDRNGAVLVGNRPSFAVSVIPVQYTNPSAVTPVVAEITGLKEAEIEYLLQSGQEYPYAPVRLKRDVDAATIAKIEERKAYLPGVIVEAVPVRYYVYGQLAAQLFGYIGRINENEFAEHKGEGYHPSDLIGKDGLESVWEKTLRGIDGISQFEVNAAGEEVGVAGEKKAIPGRSLILTIDANLQKEAEDALEAQFGISRSIGHPAKGGAVIILDVHSGAVLTMASKPAFDPNVFAGGISTRDWNALLNNTNNPLNNRTIQNAYPPGSVFKVVTAAAALDTGVTTAAEMFDDKGYYTLYGWTFYGAEETALGRLNIVGAIAKSSNPTFYELARRLGPDTLATYALTFGYGKTSGINLPGEVEGTVPTEAWKQETYKEPWYAGETLVGGIGQGYYLATPIQQALALMAVANGGIVYKPMLVDKTLSPYGSVESKLKPEILRTIYLRPEIWQTIKLGLEEVTKSGTASGVFRGFSRPVAGKTGSAETGRNTLHSWFVCYAPADNPQIVVAALLEDAGEGAVAAVPVVRRVLEHYFAMPQNRGAEPSSSRR